jgi:molybdopterin-guanine dinucleotide biosynthesis protein A
MRNMISLVAAAVFAMAMALPAFAADVTVKGEVVDIACATSKGAGGKGDGHAACAMSCARRGQPVGLLNDEAIYEITGDFAANNNAKLLDFVAKSVTVTGEVTEQGGKKLLNIKTIKAN